MALINGTQFNDDGTVNGDGKFHKSLIGTPLSDKIIGKAGNDILIGNAGNDELDGGSGNDKLLGGSGNDLLEGNSGEDQLYGGIGKDRLFGGTENDYLFGGSGNDSLTGDGGNDYLDGANFSGAGSGIGSGTEFDTLTGGTGADEFVLGNIDNVYYLGNGYATITDFSLVQSDTIQIKGILADGYSLGLSNWGGSNAQDTGIFFNGNLIGVVQDVDLTNINPDTVFSSAPPIPG
jgi:Ca2+-binding RTX toxin-like protein